MGAGLQRAEQDARRACEKVQPAGAGLAQEKTLVQEVAYQIDSFKMSDEIGLVSMKQTLANVTIFVAILGHKQTF